MEEILASIRRIIEDDPQIASSAEAGQDSHATDAPVDEEELARLVAAANEKTKLTATYINNTAVGLTTVGALGPIISIFSINSINVPGAIISALVCVSLSLAIHVVAKWTLGDIQ